MSVSEKVYLSFQLHQEKGLAARHINNRVSWSPHIHIWMYYVIKTAKSILGKPNFGILENWSGQSVRYTPRSVFLHLLRTRSKSHRAVTYPRGESRLVTKWCPPPYWKISETISAAHDDLTFPPVSSQCAVMNDRCHGLREPLRSSFCSS